MMALAQRGRQVDQQRAMMLKERDHMFKRSGASQGILLNRLAFIAICLPTVVSLLSVLG
jgi:hypothetical protein